MAVTVRHLLLLCCLEALGRLEAAEPPCPPAAGLPWPSPPRGPPAPRADLPGSSPKWQELGPDREQCSGLASWASSAGREERARSPSSDSSKRAAGLARTSPRLQGSQLTSSPGIPAKSLLNNITTSPENYSEVEYCKPQSDFFFYSKVGSLILKSLKD